MRIAVAQINTRQGDFEGVFQRVIGLAERAAAEGARLLVLPFATFTGVRSPGRAHAEGFELDLAHTLNAMARALACPCLVPITISAGPDMIVDAVLLREGSCVPLRLVASLEDARGQGSFEQPGGAFFELDDVRFAVAFDYEDLDAYADTDADVDVVLFVTRRGFAVDDSSSAMGAALAESRYCDDAWALDAWIVGVGPVGCYDLQIFTGSSFVLSPRGELKADAPAFEEAFMFAEVGVEDAGETLEPELYDRSYHLWEALTLGLRDYLDRLGKADVVLAVDGCLSSSVLAALASDAIGPTHVHAVLPADIGRDRQRLAMQLARSLRLSLGEAWEHENEDEATARDLLQVQLASVARTRGALVLSSADKTHGALEAEPIRCESAGLAPLGDVYRTDVIRIARLRNTISPVIPPESLQMYEVPCVDGLIELERSPETRLSRIDVILATHIEWGRSLSDVVARHGHEDVCRRILSKLVARQGARTMLPPCIVISSCTLREAEVPLGMAWDDRVRSEAERGTTMRFSGLVSGTGESIGVPSEGKVERMAASDVAALIEQVQEEVSRQGLETPSTDDLERQVSEILGLIRDVLQGTSAAGGINEGPLGPLTWGSPFSEN